MIVSGTHTLSRMHTYMNTCDYAQLLQSHDVSRRYIKSLPMDKFLPTQELIELFESWALR